MPRRLLPRPLHEAGKRGQILTVFGLVWIGIGYGTWVDGDPPTWAGLTPFQWLPYDWRARLWIITGLVALAYAIRPRLIPHDGIGFSALYIMPAWHVGAFAWTEGHGYSHGWLWALTYGAMVAAVMICASWPDPPREAR